MFNGSNCVRKSQLSGILTEPLNPRALSSLQGGVLEITLTVPLSKPFKDVIKI